MTCRVFAQLKMWDIDKQADTTLCIELRCAQIIKRFLFWFCSTPAQILDHMQEDIHLLLVSRGSHRSIWKYSVEEAFYVWQLALMCFIGDLMVTVVLYSPTATLWPFSIKGAFVWWWCCYCFSPHFVCKEKEG